MKNRTPTRAGLHFYRHTMSQAPPTQSIFLCSPARSAAGEPPVRQRERAILRRPSCVITTFAVAEPSYVMTSRRVDVVADCPVIVTVADIARMTVPAVGYGWGFAVVATGTTTAFTVSPATRFAVNAP